MCVCVSVCFPSCFFPFQASLGKINKRTLQIKSLPLMTNYHKPIGMPNQSWSNHVILYPLKWCKISAIKLQQVEYMNLTHHGIPWRIYPLVNEHSYLEIHLFAALAFPLGSKLCLRHVGPFCTWQLGKHRNTLV